MEKLRPNDRYRQAFEQAVFAEMLLNQLEGKLSAKESVVVTTIPGKGKAFLVEFELPKGHQYHGVSFCVIRGVSKQRVQKNIHSELTDLETNDIANDFLRRYD